MQPLLQITLILVILVPLPLWGSLALECQGGEKPEPTYPIEFSRTLPVCTGSANNCLAGTPVVEAWRVLRRSNEEVAPGHLGSLGGSVSMRCQKDCV